MESQKQAFHWARQHPDEWEIVSGVRIATIKRQGEILEMLRDAGLGELEEMLADRIMYLICDEIETEMKKGKPPHTK